MGKFLKKLGLAGIGLISITEKELKKIFDKLVKEGKLNEPEVKKLMENIKLSGDKYLDKVEASAEKFLRKAADELKKRSKKA